MRRALIAAVLTLVGCDAQWGDYGASVGPAPSEAAALAPASLPAFFDCLRENNATAVSAHRGGARRGLPENAISTFEAALRDAPVFLEIDVRAARDGLVVMHDETVDRATSGSGTVADMTVGQVRALMLDESDGEHPPSLREALDWARDRTVLELDIKQDVRFEDVIAEVRAADAMSRVVFIAYSVGAAARLARLAPEAMLYVDIANVRDLDELERRGVDLAHVVAWTGDEEPNSELNIALGQRGVEARFGMFGRNAPASQTAAFAETGLQIISTDAPDEAVASLDENDGENGYAALQCVAAQ
ncbi:MAG TPA: glycerophosphodiester phosphodiesterase family protein [Vitreimonas sp.]|nr:glycerophosphodiester phosphodiesterase family protein [Vitreimonas sp.]